MPRDVRTRKRQLPGPTFEFVNRRILNPLEGGGEQVTTQSPIKVLGTQVTVSEGHEWPPPKGSPLIDRGGDFYTSRQYVAVPRTPSYTKLRHVESNGVVYQEFGPSLIPAIPGFAANPQLLYPPSGALSNAQMDAWGAKAIAQCKPGDPGLSLSTSLGELAKDGIPAILGQAIWKAKTLAGLRKASGGEFLNFQFGYKPIVSDILKFADIVSRAEDILKQYERDAGRVVRRGFQFPIERTSNEAVFIANRYPLYLEGFPNYGEPNSSKSLYGKVMGRSDTYQRKWFSGAFTYHLPRDYHSRNEMKSLATKANVLLGTELTPETLWNLAPWSWAIDWFTNTGDVLSNLSSFITHGLVMRYGYIMVHSINTYTFTHLSYKDYPNRPNVSEVVMVSESKQRREANPFGFGLTWDGLSSSQLAIAAALGISRK